MSDDIVRQLYELADAQEKCAPYDCFDDSEELRKAADYIAALTAERDALVVALTQQQKDAKCLEF